MRFLILFLILIPGVFALNITTDFPKSVSENSEFEIEVFSNSSETFDIKIDISASGNRISRIYDGEKWKSSMYYIKSGFKEKGTYNLKVEDYIGKAELIVKLRNKKSTVTFGPYKINFKDENNKEEQASKKTEDDKEIVEKIKEFPKEKNEFIYENTIELNPKTIKTKESNSLLGEGWAKYSLGVFCLILFFLYIKKGEKKKNEFG